MMVSRLNTPVAPLRERGLRTTMPIALLESRNDRHVNRIFRVQIAILPDVIIDRTLSKSSFPDWLDIT